MKLDQVPYGQIESLRLRWKSASGALPNAAAPGAEALLQFSEREAQATLRVGGDVLGVQGDGRKHEVLLDDLGSATSDQLLNLGTGYNFEPGSTFKAFTVASALESGTVSPTSTFTLPPTIQVADREIGEAHERGWETLTTSQILAQSSNVGTITIAQKLGKQRFVRANLQLAFPDLDAGALVRRAGETWGNFGAVLAEYPHLQHWRQLVTELEIAPQSRSILEAREPAVYVSAHIANWELAVAAISGLGIPLSVVYAPQGNPLVNELIQARRQFSDCRFIGKKNCIRRLLGELEAAEAAGTQIASVRAAALVGTPGPAFEVIRPDLLATRGPLLAPVAAAYGYDKVFFGIIMIHNLEIGYLLPPLGINLLITMRIGLSSYVNRIAPPEELAPTLSAGVSVNHLSSVSVSLVAGSLLEVVGYEGLCWGAVGLLSLIHISEPTRPY